MKIIVNDIPPTNNEYMGNSHSFNKYRREKEKWHWMIKAAIKSKPKMPYEKVKVNITYYFEKKRRRDPDNYSGKFLLDPLVREGILKDDSFENIVLTIRQGGIDKDNPRTEIEIEEIKE